MSFFSGKPANYKIQKLSLLYVLSAHGNSLMSLNIEFSTNYDLRLLYKSVANPLEAIYLSRMCLCIQFQNFILEKISHARYVFLFGKNKNCIIAPKQSRRITSRHQTAQQAKRPTEKMEGSPPRTHPPPYKHQKQEYS